MNWFIQSTAWLPGEHLSAVPLTSLGSRQIFFRNEIEERKLHLATGNWEMTAGTWEGLESFEIRERQIAAKGQSGGMSSEGQAPAQLRAAVTEGKWKLKPEQKPRLPRRGICHIPGCPISSPWHPSISPAIKRKMHFRVDPLGSQLKEQDSGQLLLSLISRAFGRDRSYCTRLMFCHV